jgi:hypothetical protein
MARLILHIGMHKTGSTAIQSSLAAASGNSFIYPQLGKPPLKPHHTDSLISLFSNKAARIATDYSFAGKTLVTSNLDLERIRQAAADAGKATVILSSEGAYSFLDVAEVAALKAFAEQLFEDVQVVAYVREPVDFISSSFQALIRAQRLSTFTPRYKAYRTFENFDQVFGRENVRLWKYDRANFPDGDIVQHFCGCLGLEPLPPIALNEALSRPAVSIIYRVNRFVALSNDGSNHRALQRIRKAVIREFPHQDFPKFRLSPGTIEPLIETRLDDITWMEERLGCSLRNNKEHREHDVASELDLLKIDSSAITILEKLSEDLPPYPRNILRHLLNEAIAFAADQSGSRSRGYLRTKLSRWHQLIQKPNRVAC